MNLASVKKIAAATLLASGFGLYAQDSPAPGPPTAKIAAAPPTANPHTQADTPPGVVPGNLVHKVDPKYPSKARLAHVGGTVVLEAAIAKDGKVKDIQVISGNSLLADAAVKAVHRWQYTPFTLNGMPVEARKQITLTFKLGEAWTNCQTGQTGVYSSDDPATNPATPGNNSTAATESKGIYRVGGGVKPPRVIDSPEPQYSTRARNAKEQGTVVLWVVVTREGKVGDIMVARSLTSDLDQKATEAVCRWQFQPGTKNGKPVAVQINIEVSFRLY